MKILLINSVLGIGSTGRIVESLYKSLKSVGHDVKVAYGRNKYLGIITQDQFCFYNKLNINLHGVFSRIFDNSGLAYSKKATKKLIKFIEDFKPDVVNLHNLHGYYLNVPLLLNYLAEKNIKCVFTLHDCWLLTGHCTNVCFNQCEGFSNNCENCKFKHVYPKSLLFNKSAKNLELKQKLLSKINNKSFIVPSNWLKNYVAKSYLKNEKIDVVYNSINFNIFNQNSKNNYDKTKLPCDKYILCVSNVWNEQKGIKKIVELARFATDKKFVLVGQLKCKIELPQNVIHIEQTNNAKELAFYYANAELLFNPTLEDVFGLVTAEAMACGIPVLLYKGCSGGEDAIKTFSGYAIDKTSSTEEVTKSIDDIKQNFNAEKTIQNIKTLCSDKKFYQDYIRILEER